MKQNFSLFLIFSLLILSFFSPIPAHATEFPITPSDGEHLDWFGSSVGISNDVSIVGSAFHNSNTADTNIEGAAYIYRFDGASWIEEQKLVTSDNNASKFGTKVDVMGNVAVATAYSRYTWGRTSAYVFRWNGSTWIEEQRLFASDSPPSTWPELLNWTDGNFASSVSMSEDVIVLSRYGDDEAAENAGSIYVYRWNGSGWVEEQKLFASDSAENSYFGSDVSIYNDTIIVGAYGTDNSVGAAYIYRWNGTTWIEEQKITASDAVQGDNFGLSVSIHNDVVTVSSSDEEAGPFTGAVYVYRWDGSTWIEEQKLVASNAHEYNNFGCDISISDDTIFIGSEDRSVSLSTGAVYTFNWNGSTWVENNISTKDSFEAPFYGYQLDASGDKYIVGIGNWSNNPLPTLFPGIAYIYSGTQTGPTDQDNDGHPSDNDCDDNNASIHPGAHELCDGIDNNCNGQIDESCSSLISIEEPLKEFMKSIRKKIFKGNSYR